MALPALHGVVVPLITPTDASEDVDEHGLRALIRRLTAGAVGIEPGCANVLTAHCVKLSDAAERGDWPTVERLFGEAMWMRAPLIQGEGSWVSGLKYAASLVGIGSGRALLPIEPVTEAQKRDIGRLLAGQRITA
jgi:dihydrodipicolinate synthase/N-acetylneuraminate lyase